MLIFLGQRSIVRTSLNVFVYSFYHQIFNRNFLFWSEYFFIYFSSYDFWIIFLKVLNDQLTEKLKSITASKKPVSYRNFFISFWSSCIKQTIPRKIKQIVIYLKFRPWGCWQQIQRFLQPLDVGWPSQQEKSSFLGLSRE